MAVLLLDKKIIKKRARNSRGHRATGCQGQKLMGEQTNWRRPKGIDSWVRRKFKGSILIPNIGYGSDKKTRHYPPNGFKKFMVHNAMELELLMMHNRIYCAEISHNIPTKRGKILWCGSAQLNVVEN